MIEQRGVKLLAMAKLILPGDIRKRAALPHVAAIADGIRQGTFTTLPVARFHSRKWRLVKGADIVAAHVLLQYPDLRVQCVACSDAEAELMRLAEERDGSRDDAVKVALVEKINALREQILREPAAPKTSKGPRRSPVSAAVKEVAAATGLSERSLARLYRQQNQREGMPGADTVELEPQGPPVRDLGMPLPEDWCLRVALVQRRTVAALDGLSKAIRALGLVAEETDRGFVRELADGMKTRAEALRREVDGFYPASLCPWCKGLAGIQEACLACMGRAWIGRGKVADVPPKLWDQVDRVVMRAGSPVRVSELLPRLGKVERNGE